MDFASDYVYAPKEQKEEYEYVPESVFNHTATKDDSYTDDGEVIIKICDRIRSDQISTIIR